MTEPKSYIGVMKHYEKCTPEIRNYYDILPRLINDSYPYDIAIAYLFMKLEQAYHRILYAGCIKVHYSNAELTTTAIEKWYLTREDFLIKFKNVYGNELPKSIRAQALNAETARDNIMHGKFTDEPTKRKAIVELLDFSSELDMHVNSIADFHPFADLRGITGAAEKLDKSTTRWMLKGMGFELS